MIAWIDASAGIAGDMLLGALLDAGADLTAVQSAVDAVLPGSARLMSSQVTRAGIRGTKLDVHVLTTDPPHRHWSDIRRSLEAAALLESVRATAHAVFSRLARAEALVHGVPEQDVRFHEVGAIDSIADIVGVCAALHDLGVATVAGGPAATGSGRMQMAHGDLAVPGPAVAELLRGWIVSAGGDGELTTPTGAALLTVLSGGICCDLPAMTLHRVGVGAGSRDPAERANITRVFLGARLDDLARSEDAVLLEANIDDLDPRVWPNVLQVMLQAGAADAWLTPITMKKGRPAHTLKVLAGPEKAAALRELIIDHTTTFGLRQTRTSKFPVERGWVDLDIDGVPMPVKIAVRDGTIRRATPEYEPVAALAESLGLPTLTVLDQVRAAAAAAGLHPGAPVPTALRATQSLPRSPQP